MDASTRPKLNLRGFFRQGEEGAEHAKSPRWSGSGGGSVGSGGGGGGGGSTGHSAARAARAQRASGSPRASPRPSTRPSPAASPGIGRRTAPAASPGIGRRTAPEASPGAARRGVAGAAAAERRQGAAAAAAAPRLISQRSRSEANNSRSGRSSVKGADGKSVARRMSNKMGLKFDLRKKPRADHPNVLSEPGGGSNKKHLQKPPNDNRRMDSRLTDLQEDDLSFLDSDNEEQLARARQDVLEDDNDDDHHGHDDGHGHDHDQSPKPSAKAPAQADRSRFPKILRRAVSSGPPRTLAHPGGAHHSRKLSGDAVRRSPHHHGVPPPPDEHAPLPPPDHPHPNNHNHPHPHPPAQHNSPQHARHGTNRVDDFLAKVWKLEDALRAETTAHNQTKRQLAEHQRKLEAWHPQQGNHPQPDQNDDSAQLQPGAEARDRVVAELSSQLSDVLLMMQITKKREQRRVTELADLRVELIHAKSELRKRDAEVVGLRDQVAALAAQQQPALQQQQQQQQQQQAEQRVQDLEREMAARGQLVEHLQGELVATRAELGAMRSRQQAHGGVNGSVGNGGGAGRSPVAEGRPPRAARMSSPDPASSTGGGRGGFEQHGAGLAMFRPSQMGVGAFSGAPVASVPRPKKATSIDLSVVASASAAQLPKVSLKAVNGAGGVRNGRIVARNTSLNSVGERLPVARDEPSDSDEEMAL